MATAATALPSPAPDPAVTVDLKACDTLRAVVNQPSAALTRAEWVRLLGATACATVESNDLLGIIADYVMLQRHAWSFDEPETATAPAASAAAVPTAAAASAAAAAAAAPRSKRLPKSVAVYRTEDGAMFQTLTVAGLTRFVALHSLLHTPRRFTVRVWYHQTRDVTGLARVSTVGVMHIPTKTRIKIGIAPPSGVYALKSKEKPNPVPPLPDVTWLVPAGNGLSTGPAASSVDVTFTCDVDARCVHIELVTSGAGAWQSFAHPWRAGSTERAIASESELSDWYPFITLRRNNRVTVAFVEPPPLSDERMAALQRAAVTARDSGPLARAIKARVSKKKKHILYV